MQVTKTDLRYHRNTQGNIGEILKTSLNVFSIERLKMMFNESDFETTCQVTPDEKVNQKVDSSLI